MPYAPVLISSGVSIPIPKATLFAHPKPTCRWIDHHPTDYVHPHNRSLHRRTPQFLATSLFFLAESGRSIYVTHTAPQPHLWPHIHPTRSLYKEHHRRI